MKVYPNILVKHVSIPNDSFIDTISFPIGDYVTYPRPLFLPSYLDLNNNPRVHKQQIIYFKYLTLDKFMNKNMSFIYGYFKVEGDNVKLISDLSNFNPNAFHTDSKEDLRKKKRYIEKEYVTNKTISHILHKFIEGTGHNWYDLHKSEYYVEDAIKNSLERLLKKEITNKKHV